ncbi:MAG: hypothetical protein ACRDTT_24485 [Pseudonocardiaceae bacterium]
MKGSFVLRDGPDSGAQNEPGRDLLWAQGVFGLGLNQVSQLRVTDQHTGSFSAGLVAARAFARSAS